MVAPIAQWHDAPRTAFDDTLRIDAFGNGARLLIFAAGLLAVIVAWGMPHLLDRAFSRLGRDRATEVPMKRLDPAYRAVYPDGTQLLVRAEIAGAAHAAHGSATQEEVAR